MSYFILGFEAGCKPCNDLKELCSKLAVPYTFINAKEAGNAIGVLLKKVVKELPEEQQVVPALFKKLASGNFVLVGTGIDKNTRYLREHYA